MIGHLHHNQIESVSLESSLGRVVQLERLQYAMKSEENGSDNGISGQAFANVLDILLAIVPFLEDSDIEPAVVQFGIEFDFDIGKSQACVKVQLFDAVHPGVLENNLIDASQGTFNVNR